MVSSGILVFAQNAALLIAILFIYDLILRQWNTHNKCLKEIVTGISVGLVVTVIMSTSWQISEGVIFDARSVLLGVSGLFLGVVPTIIATIIAAASRVIMGGDGVIPGLGIILSSGLFGVLWHVYRPTTKSIKFSTKELWFFAFLLHLLYLLSVFLFPVGQAIELLKIITLPVLCVLPLATVMLSFLFIDRLKKAELSEALMLSEEKMQGLYHHSPVAIWDEDWSELAVELQSIQQEHPNTPIGDYLRTHLEQTWKMVRSIKIVDVNSAALSISGASSKEELGEGITQFFDNSTINQFIQVLEAFAEGATVHECESSFVDIHGASHWVEIRHAIMPGHEDSLGIVIVSTLNITDRKQTEDALRLSSSVYENSLEAMSVTDADGTILSINPAFSKTTGFSQSEIIGKTHRLLRSGKQDQAFYQGMWKAIHATGCWEGEIWNRRKNGEIYAEWLTINTVYDDKMQPYQRVGLSSDISQRKASEDLIQRQANFDSLTGLPNRQKFIEHLKHEINLASVQGYPIYLLMIDLDRLTEINDSLGYQVGDQLLVQSAGRIRTCLHASHMVARISGDVFAVILPDADCHGLFDHVDRTVKGIQAVLRKPFDIAPQGVHLTSSIGIASFPNSTTSAEALIQCSNLALVSAKHQGQNQRSYFVPKMKQSTQFKYAVSQDLREALACHQFSLFYQPIVNLKTQSVHKAEALIRWNHPEQGLISPADFIPVAEATGAIIEMGNWVFREAVRQVESWRQSISPDFQISINKSPVQFRSEDVHLYDWFEHLTRHGLSGEAIVVEMTEGMLMDSGPIVASKLFAMSDAGMQIALDDFGTGYSSLAYIKKYDVDYLKIDQTFVRNLTANNDDSAICESLIAMAHKLGIKVIAEGIETQDQLELLTQWGCDFGQGYYFSKPIAADQFEQQYAPIGQD